MKGLLRFTATGNEGRPRVRQGHEHRPADGGAGTRTFLVPDELLSQRRAAAAVFLWPGDASPPTLVLSALPIQVEVAQRLALQRTHLARYVGLQPAAHVPAKRSLLCGDLQPHTGGRRCVSINS